MTAFRNILRGAVLVGLLGATALWAVLVAPRQPSNDRDWTPDQARLARATISGETVRLDNVRNATYRSTEDYDVAWETRVFELASLETVWFVVEPFSDWRGPAHTFLSFGFTNGRYIAISVEVRKEKGEEFSPLGGLLRRFELSYVVGDERDLIGLRANHRKDPVYLYPVRATPEARRALFLGMLGRVNDLADRPEFYNSLTSTCTTNIVDHIRAIAPGRVPWSYKVLLPGFADDLAYELGLLDTDLPRESFREAHRINDLAAELADAESRAFSAGIRSRYESSTSTPSPR